MMRSSQRALIILLALALLSVWIIAILVVPSNNGFSLQSLLPPTITPQPSSTPIACTDENKRAFAREAINLVYEQDADLNALNYADIDTFPEDDPLGGFVGRANSRRIELGNIQYPRCISTQRDALLEVFDNFYYGVSALRDGNISKFEQHFTNVASSVDPAVDAVLLLLP